MLVELEVCFRDNAFWFDCEEEAAEVFLDSFLNSTGDIISVEGYEKDGRELKFAILPSEIILVQITKPATLESQK